MILGKNFEKKFEEDWKKAFPQTFVYRVPDQQSGYKGTSRNICDFFCFTAGLLFLIECKSCKGASFPLSRLTQLEKMSKYGKIKGIHPGVVIWYYEKDKVVYVPISTCEEAWKSGKKSLNLIKLLEGQYGKSFEIPSTKKRTYMDSNYGVLKEIEVE